MSHMTKRVTLPELSCSLLSASAHCNASRILVKAASLPSSSSLRITTDGASPRTFIKPSEMAVRPNAVIAA